MDFFLALFAIIFLSPVFLVVALLVRTRIGSPVLFKQKRPGLNGEIFILYKFRTMTHERDSNGNLLPDSVRLTKFGKLLRSTSLDELPEFFNILRGDMSIVGPRPLLLEYLPLYNAHQRQRHDVRPGLSGLAQVRGRNSISWEEKFDLDVKYVERVSFIGDWTIILNTILKTLSRDGIDSEGGVLMGDFKGSKETNRIFLASPHMCGKEQEHVLEGFRSNWIAPVGPHINDFEKEVAEYVGVKAAVALSSGTAAIHLALIALGVGKGDEVFCSSLTFVASANPIIYQGATPVFIDCERDSYNMSPVALKKAFKKHAPKAVIVVNLYGQSADMDTLKDICDEHSVPIIEDAAESLGAKYKGKMSGSFGKFGVFSFNGNKIITTSGGGMLVSDDEEAINKVRFWATQAKDKARIYHHSELGFNYRMSNICAGIGRGQLTVIDERVKQKKAIYERYKDAFTDIRSIHIAPMCVYGEANYWLTTMTIRDCDVKPLDVILALEKENIESRHVWKPMHLQPLYEHYSFYNHHNHGISVSEDLFKCGVCLPSDTKMTPEDMDRVIKAVRACWGAES